MIPTDEHGYSILGSEVHRRHADHAVSGRKVRTVMGLLNIGGGRELHPCPSCYPSRPEVSIAPVPVEVEVMPPDDIDVFGPDITEDGG